MVLRVVLIIVVVLSVGCAHVANGDMAALKASVEPLTAVEQKTPEVKSVQEAASVPVEPSKLDAALLYSLLGGELAGQRGEVGLASFFYLNAAKRSKDPQVALRAAQIALYNKDITAAKSAVDILIADENMTVPAHKLALTIYLRSAELEKSLQQIELILKKSELPIRNMLLAIGDVVSRNASHEMAASVMNVLVNKHPEEASVYLARSQILSRLGEFKQAARDAVKSTQLAPSWPTGFIQLALVLENSGDTDGALAILKQASQRLKTRQLMMGYGQLLAKNEQYEAAKESFLSLVSVEQDYPEAMFALGLVYLKLDDAIKAAGIFESLYEAKAFPSKSAFYLGRISYYQKEYKKALAWFEKVAVSVHYIDAQASIAMIKSEAGDLPGARAVLQRLRNDYPKKSVRFYLLEAELLMDGGHMKRSYEILTEAIESAPDDLALRYARSIAATEIGKLELAEKDLLFVLEREPKDVNALNALGYTLASKTFRFKEARYYLAQALALKPNDAAILDSMGWLNYREGRYEQALILLEKAYKTEPEGEIAAHLGETMWMLGRQKEARGVWEEALERDAGNRYLIEVLQRLK